MRSLMLFPAVVVAAIPLTAAVSPEHSFDGTYSGAIRPAPIAVTATVCGQAPLSVTVADGKISSQDASLSGFVNVKAFVTGQLRAPDGHTLPFQGRVEPAEDNAVHLTAGVVDDATNCEWTIDLVKR